MTKSTVSRMAGARGPSKNTVELSRSELKKLAQKQKSVSIRLGEAVENDNYVE